MSTAGPDVAKEIVPQLKKAGAQFVEAPVLGSVGAVESGTLVVLGAGDDSAIDRALPVLQALGEVRPTGSLGSAASLKLVANSMLAGVTAVAAELQAAGTASGLDPEDVFWAISRIAPVLNARKAGLVEHRYEPVTFALRDIVKDLQLAIDLFGRRTGAKTPVTRTAVELYARAADSAGGERHVRHRDAL